MLNWSPSDQIYLQADWLSLVSDSSNFQKSDANSHLLTLHGELRQQMENFDIRVLPGVALHPDKNEIAGKSFEGFVSSSRLRLQGLYQEYADDYQNLYRPQAIIGNIQKRENINATFDAFSFLRLSGEWKHVTGQAQSHNRRITDENQSVGFLLHQPNLPGWQCTIQQFITHWVSGNSAKYFIQNRWEYQFPASLTQKLRVQGLKIDAWFRTGQQEELSDSTKSEQKFRQGYVRLNSIFQNRFQTSIFYRRNDLDETTLTGKQAPLSRSERLLFDLSHEEWRLLQINFRIENLLNQNFHYNSSRRNAQLRQFSQMNFRFSPGQIWSRLSPLYFELNLNQSLNGWDTPQSAISDWLWQVFSDDLQGLNHLQRIRNYYLKNEYRPAANWLITSLLEFNEQEQRPGVSQLTNQYWRWSERIDVKVGFKTRYVVQYRQFFQDMDYGRTMRYFEPSTWVEHRWTPDLQNNLNLLYRHRKTEQGGGELVAHNWEGRYDLIWRKYQFWHVQRLEIRLSFAGNYQQQSGYYHTNYYQLSSSSSLDIYPLHSMIIRLRVDLNQYLDALKPLNDYWSLRFNFKLSLRF
jgi:hypothetical protein